MPNQKESLREKLRNSGGMLLLLALAVGEMLVEKYDNWKYEYFPPKPPKGAGFKKPIGDLKWDNETKQ